MVKSGCTLPTRDGPLVVWRQQHRVGLLRRLAIEAKAAALSPHHRSRRKAMGDMDSEGPHREGGKHALQEVHAEELLDGEFSFQFQGGELLIVGGDRNGVGSGGVEFGGGEELLLGDALGAAGPGTTGLDGSGAEEEFEVRNHGGGETDELILR